MSQTPNRLAQEKSPYLQQHAMNPVDWYPWGPEAFEKARQEDKPILVSIGYSTCHWCHVMEKESYENGAVAALMNHFLVNIKVDREERPDVDKIYMTAVSAMTGQGGWPLNIFLTPDLRPIIGGTYFPPSAKWGQPAWRDVVTQVGQAWRDPESRSKMLEAAERITEALRQHTSVSQDPLEPDASCLDEGFRAFRSTFDSSHGGFGPAPKFPMPVYQNFLLRYYARTHIREALEMSLSTLRAMARGGIYDHLGGGFARYSTDERWHIPHFEKMLYDNAQLAVNYLDAFQITQEADFKRVAQETLRYIQRDMTHTAGGFYSAEDADSLPSADSDEKTEGAFYVWTKDEILQILGKEAGELFCSAYGVEEGGNALPDPHGEFIGKNILFRSSEGDTLAASREKLRQVRANRPRPHFDDKIISGWNGLMISAFARAFQVLGDSTYLESARRAAQFLKSHLYEPGTGTLFRRWRQEDRQVSGIADDYAFAAQGALDLYEAEGDADWLEWAAQLTDQMIARFYDEAHGGFYMTAADQDNHLILRIKEEMDNVEPSASSVAVLNLLRLSQLTGRTDFEERAQKTLRTFGASLKDNPRALPQMLVALDVRLTEPRQIVIVSRGPAGEFLGPLREQFIPVKTVILLDGEAPNTRMAKRLPFVSDMKSLDGQPTAYVCIRHTCQPPTRDLQTFRDLIRAL